MSNYFRYFPITSYKFGNEESTNAFQKINAYIDLIDQVKDVSTFYNVYNISEFERPDTLSHKLYGTSNYAWTFFLLNEKLRTRGWPMSNLDLYRAAKDYYPNIVLNTRHNIAFTRNISIGDTIQSFTNPSQTGIVRDINYDMGQVMVERSSFFNPFSNGYVIKQGSELDINLSVSYYSQANQYEAVHHYETTEGERVDYLDVTENQTSAYNLTFKETSNLNPVTNIERLRNLNMDQKQIRVFKPNLIAAIVRKFDRLMQEGNTVGV